MSCNEPCSPSAISQIYAITESLSQPRKTRQSRMSLNIQALFLSHTLTHPHTHAAPHRRAHLAKRAVNFQTCYQHSSPSNTQAPPPSQTTSYHPDCRQPLTRYAHHPNLIKHAAPRPAPSRPERPPPVSSHGPPEHGQSACRGRVPFPHASLAATLVSAVALPVPRRRNRLLRRGRLEPGGHIVLCHSMEQVAAQGVR